MTFARLLAALVALSFVAHAPAASADALDALNASGQYEQADCAVANPPCGWINPLIALDFDDKPLCRMYPTDCMQPPVSEPLVLSGEFRWYWEVSEDGTYPDDPATDIVVTFSGTASNPEWVDFKVEPETITITSADLVDPNRYETDASDPANMAVWYSYNEPITITFTRTGEPSAAEMTRIEERGGLQSVFLKAKSSASSDRFKEAFGVEEFRFDAYSDETMEAPGQEAPGMGMLAGMGVLAAAGVASRRRL